jgi:hypothetical protein
MKSSLFGVTLALGLSASALVAFPAQAAPAYQEQLGGAYSGLPVGPAGPDFPSAPLAGDLVFDLANTGAGFVSPLTGPLLGNQGVQGALIPLFVVGQQGLALVPEIPFATDLLGPSLQPVLGIVVPAAAPAAVGLLTLDPALLASGGISFVNVLLAQLVPTVLGNLPVIGGLGSGTPVIGNLDGLPFIGSLAGGGVPIIGSLDGLPFAGTLLGGGLPVIGSFGNFGSLLGGIPVLGSLGGGLPVVGVLGNSGGLLTGVLGGAI